MYFSRIYEFSERMKVCLNAVNGTIDDYNLDTGAAIRAFAKDFRQELTVRNSIHHKSHFEDLILERVSITGLISRSDAGTIEPLWNIVHRQAYRQMQKEWTERIRRRSQRARVYLDAVADAMKKHCAWLREPIN